VRIVKTQESTVELYIFNSFKIFTLQVIN